MRRRDRFWLGLALALLAPGASAEKEAARAHDWSGFLGPHGDATSDETGLVLRWGEGGPPVLWQVGVGEGYSMASISGGRLFLFDRQEKEARLRCLDAQSGKELWRSEYTTTHVEPYGFSNGPRCSPVIDEDRVYIFGVEGRLRCHRVLDGKLLWEVDTARAYGVVQNFFGVGSTPVIEGKLLIAQIGGSPAGSPAIDSGTVRGNGTGIVAFDKRTGEERYRLTDELASYASPVVRTIGGRRFCFVFARGGLVAFEPEKGKLDFAFPWRAKKHESVNAANPVVVDDTVFVTESYGPGAAWLRVKPGGYEVLRQDPPGGDGTLRSHWATPIHHEGYLYGCSGEASGEAELRAVKLASGEVAWRRAGLGRSTALLVDGHLIVLTEKGELLVVRATPDKYDEVSRVKPGDANGPLLEPPAWNPPALARGLLYARGKRKLVCFDLRRPAAGERP